MSNRIILKLKKIEKFGRVYLSFFVSIACIWWLYHSVEGKELFLKVKNVKTEYLFLAFVSTVASYLIRAWRWRYFFGANPPNYYDSFRCLIVGFFMNNILPARMGELVRAHLGGRATGQSRTLVLATIAGERLADGLVISLLFAVLFTTASTAAERESGSELFVVAYLFVAAAGATAAILFFRRRIFKLLERAGSLMRGAVSQFGLTRIKRFIEGLEPLLHPRRIVVLSVLSILVWSVELAAYHQITRAFDTDLTLGGLSLFLAAVNFSSLIPAAPGAIGVIEWFATLVLERIGVDRESALAMVAAQHLIQYAVVGIPGIFFFFVGFKGKIPQEEEEDQTDADKQELSNLADAGGA